MPYRLSEKDYVGKRYNRLTIISFDGFYRNNTVVKCLCDCGSIKICAIANVKRGSVKSCGCLWKESLLKNVERRRKHGLYLHPIYNSWSSMQERCLNSKSGHYFNYGGRGIEICEEWKGSPLAFIEWSQKNGWEKGLQIDRIDNNKGYYPENCRWASRKTNSRNKRTNMLITYKGQTKSAAEWGEEFGIKGKLIYQRLASGWAMEKIENTPVQSQFNRYKHN